jgi:hypothetical protein
MVSLGLWVAAAQVGSFDQNCGRARPRTLRSERAHSRGPAREAVDGGMTLGQSASHGGKEAAPSRWLR